MRHWLLVFSNPSPGAEDAYNAWYDHQHLGDLLRVPGVISAKRLKASDVQFNLTDKMPSRYLAVYEIEMDDPSSVFEEIRARTGTASMPISESIDLSSVVTMTFAVCP